MSALDGWIDVARTGTWRDSKGQTVSLSRQNFDSYVAAHAAGDPAPIVVGHPAHDSPAFAWVEGMRRAGDRLQVKLRDIQPKFREAVESGLYAARSVAIDGGRIRHVGFLGGKAPAIPGLVPTQFAGEAERAIEFAAAELAAGPRGWALRAMARIARGWREYIVEKEGVEAADRVIPGYEIDTISEAAEEESGDAPTMAGAEAPAIETQEDQVTGTETGAAAPSATELAAREAAVAEREAQAEARDAAAAKTAALAAADAWLEDHVRAGRVLPAERAGVAALLAYLPEEGDETVIRFASPPGSGSGAGSGEGEIERRPREILEALLAALPGRVTFGEIAGGEIPSAEGAGPGFAIPADAQVDPASLAVHNRAVALSAERDIPYIEAAMIAAQGG